MYVDEKGPNTEGAHGPHSPHGAPHGAPHGGPHGGPPHHGHGPRGPHHDSTDDLGGAVKEDARDVLVFDWSQKLTCFGCSCFSFLRQLVLIAAIGSFLFGFNLGLLNTCINHIGWDYKLCDFEGTEEIVGCTLATNFKSFISTAVFIGAAIGSMTGGSFMSYGRRGMLILSLCVFIFGIVSSVCANSFSALLWARLVCGYAVGLISVAVPTYMSEMTPPNVRGKYGVYHQLFVTVGILVADLIGLPIINSPVPDGEGPHDPIDTFSAVWWRVMLGVGILPVIMMMHAFMSVYKFETPHYYVEEGHYADAEMLLRKILVKDNVSVELKEITDEIEAGKRAQEAGMSLGTAWRQADMRKVIIFGCALSAFQQLGGINVFIAASTDLFNEAGLEGGMATLMTVIMALINCVMTIPAVYLVEKLGRRTLMVWGTIVQTIAVLPATICYWTLEEDSDVTMYLAIAGCLLYIVAFAATYGPILWVYLFEIYPIEIKGAAAGLATAFNWIAGIIMVFVQGYLENDVLYLLFTIMCGIGALLVFTFMLETKGRVLGDSPFIKKSG